MAEVSGEHAGHVRALDGLRGCAILMVLIWHYGPCQILPTTTSSILHAVRTSGSLMWSGVDLFFVLSGYFIGGIALDARGQPGFFSNFYKRRARRILPLYAVLLASYALVVVATAEHGPWWWLREDPIPFWSYATFTQNVVMSVHGSTGPNWLAVTWSLAIEEQFYLFLPLTVYVLSRRALVGVALALIAAAVVIRAAVSPFTAFVLTIGRADALLVGVLIAIALRDTAWRSALERNVRWIRFALLALILGAVAITLHPDQYGTWTYAYLAALYGTVLMCVLLDDNGRLAAILQNGFLVHLGVISYGLYLMHQPISGILHATWGSTIPNIQTATGFVITGCALILSISLATLSRATFEKYFLAPG